MFADAREQLSKRRRTDDEIDYGVDSRILSQSEIERELCRQPRFVAEPCNVLVITVLNPSYHITTQIMHNICSAHGKIRKIVMMRKRGCAALVEFETIKEAMIAKEKLHGCDIYQDCCTLKIEFGKDNPLSIHRNDADTWDFTVSDQLNDGDGGPPKKKRTVLLSAPEKMNRFCGKLDHHSRGEFMQRVGWNHGNSSLMNFHKRKVDCQAYDGGRDMSMLSDSRMYDRRGRYPSIYGLGDDRGPFLMEGDRRGDPFMMENNRRSGSFMIEDIQRGRRSMFNESGFDGASDEQYHRSFIDDNFEQSSNRICSPPMGCVLMFCGLNPNKMNPDRLFNILCQYDNVVRIKFLRSKEGSAMVQMGDRRGALRVRDCLDNISFFGSLMTVRISEHVSTVEPMSHDEATNKKTYYKDFTSSKNNRFLCEKVALKNRMLAPSKLLHFFNAPPHLKEEDIDQLFSRNDLRMPQCVKKFSNNNVRSGATGIIEFGTVSDAIEALAILNHIEIPTNLKVRFPYDIKLSFTNYEMKGSSTPQHRR